MDFAPVRKMAQIKDFLWHWRRRSNCIGVRIRDKKWKVQAQGVESIGIRSVQIRMNSCVPVYLGGRRECRIRKKPRTNPEFRICTLLPGMVQDAFCFHRSTSFGSPAFGGHKMFLMYSFFEEVYDSGTTRPKAGRRKKSAWIRDKRPGLDSFRTGRGVRNRNEIEKGVYRSGTGRKEVYDFGTIRMKWAEENERRSVRFRYAVFEKKCTVPE